MEALIIEAIRANAPLLIVVGIGFWRVVAALHKIDRRMVRVETKLWPRVKQGDDE